MTNNKELFVARFNLFYDTKCLARFLYEIAGDLPPGAAETIMESRDNLLGLYDLCSSLINNINWRNVEMTTEKLNTISGGNVKIKADYMTITPKIASAMLDKNHSNRPISKNTVRQYARDMKRGRWTKSHQGILIGRNGNLIDGQHRLKAIIDSNVSVEMLVYIDESFNSALMENIDIGRKRTNAISLGICTRDSAACSFMLRVGLGISKPSPYEVFELYEKILPLFDKLPKTTQKGISTPVFVAAIYWLWITPQYSDWICNTYKMMLIPANSKNLDQCPWSLYQQLVIERINYSHHEVLARALKSFDFKNRNLSRVQFKDVPAAISKATNEISYMMSKIMEEHV